MGRGICDFCSGAGIATRWLSFLMRLRRFFLLFLSPLLSDDEATGLRLGSRASRSIFPTTVGPDSFCTFWRKITSSLPVGSTVSFSAAGCCATGRCLGSSLAFSALRKGMSSRVLSFFSACFFSCFCLFEMFSRSTLPTTLGGSTCTFVLICSTFLLEVSSLASCSLTTGFSSGFSCSATVSGLAGSAGSWAMGLGSSLAGCSTAGCTFSATGSGLGAGSASFLGAGFLPERASRSILPLTFISMVGVSVTTSAGLLLGLTFLIITSSSASDVSTSSSGCSFSTSSIEMASFFSRRIFRLTFWLSFLRFTSAPNSLAKRL